MTDLKGAFFIVGPTATGKSELAADVARETDVELVNADAFQIYRGFDLLTAKPDARTLGKVRHHLIGTISILDEMNAEKFRQLALRALAEIHSRGKGAIVVGGGGLYLKALTHGFSSVSPPDPKLRAKLSQLSLDQLRRKLNDLDPKGAGKIDLKNRRRLIRAIEICSLSGCPASEQRSGWSAAKTAAATIHGVFVFRERDELYQRINRRVEAMFKEGVIEEVRAAGAMSETASQMIGLREVRELLEGRVSIRQCVTSIQQATRRYAKRQLTWFRRQTNFESLNLSPLTHQEAVKWISQRLQALRVVQGND